MRALLARGPSGWGNWRARLQDSARSRGAQQRCRAASGTPANRGSYLDRVKGWQGPWKAALTSGSLSAAGDLLAQLLVHQSATRKGDKPPAYDPSRTLRMFGFGLLWYGPLQFYWYNLLDWTMPVKCTPNFLAKVALNQLVLAPVVLSTVFAWNLGLTGKSAELPAKLTNDLWPTMQNGWKFWIPAASINFFAIPVDKQVLYMSACGVLWTAYLSYASATPIAAPVPAPAAVPAIASPKGKGKGRS